MGAKCIPEIDSHGQVMQLNAVKCSATNPQKPTTNGAVAHDPSNDPVVVKGRLPASKPPPTTAQTPTITTSAPSLITPSAETRSLPGKFTHHRKQSGGNNSLKTNGAPKSGDSLSRSTSTMSSGSIASNISQICDKYFIQPLIRSRSLPSNMAMGSNTTPNNPNGQSGGRKIPYIHLRRRKGKCVRKFCMRFLPPATACSGIIAVQLNVIAERQLGPAELGTGDKPAYPLGFSKGNNGSEHRRDTNTEKLQRLREAVKTAEEEHVPLYNFFICHTEDDYVPFVDKLVKKCEKEDIAIFSRSYSLLWGDSQRMDTEHAISSAMFGIVLLSPALLNNYRNSWCEKDLDVLFDRSTNLNMHSNLLLPIYCGGITKEQVQQKYPFLATQVAFVYEDVKVAGIVTQMKRVLEKRRKQGNPATKHPEEKIETPLKTVSELDIECEMRPEESGAVCTPRPTSLQIDGTDGSSGSNTTNSSCVASTPSKRLCGVLKSSGSSSRSGVKKILRIDPDPKVLRKKSATYRNDGTVNHCCHCGPMSSKYKNTILCHREEMDKEAQQMEELHRAEMEGDVEEDDGDNEDDEDKFLEDQAILNARLPMDLSAIPYDLVRLLCIMLDPLSIVGSDFTTFAAEIGFCTAYIRYLKALDIKNHSPFEEILLQWQDNAPDTTVGDLVYLLHAVKRHDAVCKLREFYHI